MVRRVAVIALLVATLAIVDVTRPASASHDTTCDQAMADGTAIVGTPGRDVLVGTLNHDVIVGLGGDDVLLGLAGSDRICPGTGNDLVDGAGALPGEQDIVDYHDHPSGITADLQAGVVTTLYHGGSETDTLVGIEGIAGSPHADTITGTVLADFIDGRGGDDEISGLGNRVAVNQLPVGSVVANEFLFGGDGNDRIAAGLVGTFVAGLFEAYGWMHIDGGPGNDTLEAIWDSSRGVMWGGPGDDTFVLSNDDDNVVGGDGHDTVSYHWTAADLTIDLALRTQDTGAGTDTFESIEHARGGSGDDTLLGSNGNNKLFGDDGDDVLTGRGGTDYADGGDAFDRCSAETRVFCEA